MEEEMNTMTESNRSQKLLGKTLGTCTIERIIGQGGMGVVYLARQQRPSRRVAVKVLFSAEEMNSQVHQHYLARFRREADIIAALDHVNIVPIYEYGEQDGLAYLVMPYLQGGSLHDILTQHGQLSLQKTVEYMNQVASGLDYAHAHGVIHRDLKPANFLFHTDGRLLLSDFGIARIMQVDMAAGVTEAAEAPLTRTGMLPGTPHYMAPEMFRGEQIDHRVDLYASGIILYQLLSGRMPFDGDNPYAIIMKHMQELPPSLHQLDPTIPLDVDAVVRQALAKKPDDRFPSATDLAQALSNAAVSSAHVNGADLSDAPTLRSSENLPWTAVGSNEVPVQQTSSQRHSQRRGRHSEERKLVTILFIAVDAASSLDETLDPEDISASMDRYHTLVQKVISNYGGTFETLAGDTGMAIFGLPQVYGDEAERACAAALALREAVKSNQVQDEGLLLQIGINTGEVVVTGDSSTGKYDVKGEGVNIATRLQQAANADEILADERTVQAAQATYIFGEERPIKLKGRKQSLRASSLIEVHQTRQIDRPTLVGRRQDLLQLELLKARVVEEHRPQLVSIIAPAGTGKSRLLEEFLARIDDSEGFHVATARSLPYGQSLTYWPLRGLLAELLDSEIDRPRVIDAFVRGGHTPETAARLALDVLTTLSVEQEEQTESTEREHIFSAWRLLIESFARQTPRIVVFEDLHWADDRLLDLVEHIMHPRSQAPLLVIALSRPELLDRRPTWGGGQQNFIMLNLEPLSAVQTRELVGRLMAELSSEMRERIVERSGGNPFFAIELVRVMAEQENTGKGIRLDILPDTVHAAVLARLDRLAPQQRRIMQVASVVERTFRSTMLQAVLNDLQPGEINAALDALCLRNLIVPAEEGSYTFRHVLIRDVAYGTLSRAERIRLHGAIVSAFEPFATEHVDEYMELFAYHYREAAQLARQSAVPIDLPFDLNQALHSWRRRDRGNWLDLDFS
ncbi:MAG TPA: hypothetical protein DHW02_13760 [Ktedonobacter sp.]|nr:hypothetical protein [Ktedonobacter sp.]